MVYAGVRRETLAALPALPNATGVVSTFDLRGTVDLARLLQPGLQNLFVVTGSADFDVAWEAAARRELQSYQESLTLTYLTGMTQHELLAALEALPPRSAVLYLTITRDADGTRFVPVDFAERIVATANAPVYGVYTTYVNRGVVGGSMSTFAAMAEGAADIGIRILNQENAADLPPSIEDVPGPVVNWETLKHWGLNADVLPSDTVFVNREESLWDRYQNHILILISLMILKTLLIVALLAQGRRRRRAELSQRESEARMKLAVSSAKLGLWRWHQTDDRVWTTSRCREILGLPSGERYELADILKRIHPRDRPAVRRRIEESLKRLQPFEIEHRINMAGQPERWVITKGECMRDEEQGSVQMSGAVVDISERKRTQAELEQQREQLTHLTRVRILGELSGTLAHELNQPLAAILSNAQVAQRILRHDQPDLEETRAIIDDIIADDHRAGEVIRRLRALLKRDDTSFDRVDLNEIMREMVDLARSELVTHQVRLDLDLAAELPAICGDRIQIQQVVLNLIVNACEAMRDVSFGERVLEISTASRGNDVEVNISDTGHGIPMDIAEQLFEPFFTTKAHGLGLGLSISRAIITAHNGQMRAMTNGVRGATFSIVVPAIR